MDEDATIQSISAGISDAAVISILFPALRRSLVIDTRSAKEDPPFVRIMPQVASFEERMKSIEELRPNLGKVRAILGIPWMRSLRELEDAHIPESLVDRLVTVGLARGEARSLVYGALRQLRRYERMAFARLVGGTGFRTIWTAAAKE
jgi:hypothetical protein